MNHLLIRYASWTVIALSVAVLYRALPVAEAVDRLSAYAAAMGRWGPVGFVGVYALASVLLVPASLLTLAAGAVFGLGLGVVTVSAGSMTGAAASFLIARYALRGRVRARAEGSRVFRAVDGAARDGGWKVVALLRLSPAVPFTLQNYLLGVSGVRLGPYLLASWLAMIPGTFLFVYLGTAAGTAARGGMSAGRWGLLVVGVGATAALTFYLAKLARRRLVAEGAARAEGAETSAVPAAGRGGPAWRLPVLAALAAALAGGAWWGVGPLMARLGPVAVTMREAYAPGLGGPVVDHGALTELLSRCVDEDGGVDYAWLARRQAELDAYLDRVAEAPFDALGRDEKLALLINLYNAATLRLMTEYPGVESIRSIPAAERWDAVRWAFGGRRYSLAQIEHEAIRPNFVEPRVHWALVCAAVDCPPLRREAYTAAGLDGQLDDQARRVFTRGSRWFAAAADHTWVRLSPILRWYAGDFEQADGGVLAHVAVYDAGVAGALAAGGPPRVGYLGYDWSLNTRANVRDARSAGGEGAS